MGKYIGVLGSFASIITLFYIDVEKHPYWRVGMFCFGIIALIVATVLEVVAYTKEKPRSFDRQGNINYMHRIISQEGRMVIFAGALSWVDNEKIKQALINKGGDLSLCVKKTAPFLDEFRKAGVRVYTYGDGEFSPKTHFTLVRHDSMNQRIAITSILDGYDKEKRLIYEISKDDKDFKNRWVVYAAEDLFNLTKIINGE